MRRDTGGLIGISKAARQTVHEIASFGPSSAPVLITGESGTGKEVVARLLHGESQRRTEPYVTVNCAALSESLIESELFGHSRGAFTGAMEDRIGRFEAAGRGTLLLDEISEIAPVLQAKLLRVLEEEEFQRVGSNVPIPMEARILATSNRILDDAVKMTEFRQDLLYRLNVLQIHLRPLRDRREDIPALVNHFLERFCHEGNGTVLRVHADAMKALQSYAWPGNVRQLRNVVHRLCVVVRDAEVQARDLAFLLEDASERTNEPSLYDLPLRDAENVLIQAALRRFHGNRTAAARHLGVTSRTLHNKLRAPESSLVKDAA